MIEPIATADDVRRRLNLPDSGEFDGSPGISDSDIEGYLEDAALDNARANSETALESKAAEMGTEIDADDVRKQIEWRLAGIKILSYRKGLRAYHQQSLGSMSRSYEVRSVPGLRDELADWDPSGGLGGGAVRRNSSRSVRSARLDSTTNS